jgi:SAM-dependent methyltransferase
MGGERLAYSDAESSSVVVQALCRDLVSGGVNLDIHADDEMLHFFLYTMGYPLEQAVAAYLDSGARIWGAFRQIIAWRFGSPQACGRILDFASGYGRVTRHIVAEVPRTSVWVSDVYAEGVGFQQRTFGVQGIVSTTEPEDFRVDVSFDSILVSSLFTHLPPARFGAWLRRLGTALSPGGMVLFSVHDLSLRRDGPLPAPDIAFVPASESGSLSPQEYGTTWVSEDYVRAAVKGALGECAVHRIPRGLTNFQDLYVVIADPDCAAHSAAFAGLRVKRQVDGFVEHCSRSGRRGLRLSGWVGDRLTGRPPEEVRVSIDGRLAAACPAVERREIQVLPSDPLMALGWQLRLELPPGTADGSVLSVSVLTSDGQEAALYSDSVLGALLRSAQLDLFALGGSLEREARLREEMAVELNGRIDALTGQIDARLRQIQGMEASRFWKLRNHWVRLKRLAGLTPAAL